MRFTTILFILLVLTTIGYAREYTQDYLNPLTSEKVCLQGGNCVLENLTVKNKTIINETVINGGTTVDGDFSVTGESNFYNTVNFWSQLFYNDDSGTPYNILTDLFVNKTGDTMTGDLTMDAHKVYIVDNSASSTKPIFQLTGQGISPIMFFAHGNTHFEDYMNITKYLSGDILYLGTRARPQTFVYADDGLTNALTIHNDSRDNPPSFIATSGQGVLAGGTTTNGNARVNGKLILNGKAISQWEEVNKSNINGTDINVLKINATKIITKNLTVTTANNTEFIIPSGLGTSKIGIKSITAANFPVIYGDWVGLQPYFGFLNGQYIVEGTATPLLAFYSSDLSKSATISYNPSADQLTFDAASGGIVFTNNISGKDAVFNNVQLGNTTIKGGKAAGKAALTINGTSRALDVEGQVRVIDSNACAPRNDAYTFSIQTCTLPYNYMHIKTNVQGDQFFFGQENAGATSEGYPHGSIYSSMGTLSIWAADKDQQGDYQYIAEMTKNETVFGNYYYDFDYSLYMRDSNAKDLLVKHHADEHYFETGADWQFDNNVNVTGNATVQNLTTTGLNIVQGGIVYPGYNGTIYVSLAAGNTGTLRFRNGVLVQFTES